MHYHSSKKLIFLNILIEFGLLILAYWFAGIVRLYSPIGNPFLYKDMIAFERIAWMYSVIIVLCYIVDGAYRSLHYGSSVRMAAKVAMTNLVGFALTATVLYIFRINQFSRLLLGLFYVMTVAFIVLKRIVFHCIGAEYVRRHKNASNVLIIGSCDLAKRFYQNAILKNPTEYHYAGYLSDEPNDVMPHYFGTVDHIYETLQSHKIDYIVMAMESQSGELVKKMVLLADTYKIRIGIVPVYNDYILAKNAINSYEGIRMIEMKMKDTCKIMGVNIAVTDMDRTVALIDESLERWRGKYICVANVHTTVTASKEEDYLAIQNNAALALPDGGPLSKYSREKGFQDAKRVTGPDLMQEILKKSGEKKWKHYFYGSTQETLDMLKEKLAERYPDAEVVGMYSPPFRELTPQEDAQIVKDINAANPDFVWVGLGAPKQERWMAAHEDRVQALMIGVGAAFDYEAGNIKRAPEWMQKANLEWLYRMMQDPKRLFKRYFQTNIKYLFWKWRN